jgi:hypothetical protein
VSGVAGGSVQDVQQLLRVEQLRSKRNSWMVYTVSTMDDMWFAARGMPPELQSKREEAKIWEVLVR